MKGIAIYPGSFDPITNGHLSLIHRGLQIFDKVIVAVGINPEKSGFFPIDERVEIIREVLKDKPGVEVDTFTGLTVEYVKSRGGNVIMKGIRAMSDFESEFQYALMNRRLEREIQSIFLMTDYKWFYISSSIIKEVASFGGDISGMVPPLVNQRLKEKFTKG
ncbi:MAG: pantetheine-phosphate adenylyltransferase [Deltaproteobacteria bacterium]|nr:pantetheine-phosphate adenylyltransferase [Deltaproteobacteria bacterium]